MSHRKETDIVHGKFRKNSTNSLINPIEMTSTFTFNTSDEAEKSFNGSVSNHLYSRLSNPTVEDVQKTIAYLENAEAGIMTSSGMSAVSSVVLTLCKPGDNFVSCSSIYGGTFALFAKDLKKFDIKPVFLPSFLCNDPKSIEGRISFKTKFLYIETPSNPTLDVIDIALWASVAKKHNIPLVVDNTFASPYLTRPVDLGADIVIHSTTKYLNGHGDIIGGAIVSDQKMINRINEECFYHFGPCMSPFNAWLISRGIKTLAVRMERHCKNAQEVAEWLNVQKKEVKNIYYPGLKDHSGYAIAKKQMNNMFGGMIAFELEGGIGSGKKFLDALEMIKIAVSLGDCETLIQHPATMTHSLHTPEERKAAGIADGLIRLSVGLEHSQDIIYDLEQALKKI